MKRLLRRLIYTKKRDLSNYDTKHNSVVLISNNCGRRDTYKYNKIYITDITKSHTGRYMYLGTNIQHGFFDEEVVDFRDFTILGKILVNIWQTFNEIHNPTGRIKWWYYKG